ncbi:Uncharacterised protein [Salmonella enterica]|nr:Uncharacterised protein [Salmonella enterica]
MGKHLEEKRKGNASYVSPTGPVSSLTIAWKR